MKGMVRSEASGGPWGDFDQLPEKNQRRRLSTPSAPGGGQSGHYPVAISKKRAGGLRLQQAQDGRPSAEHNEVHCLPHLLIPEWRWASRLGGFHRWHGEYHLLWPFSTPFLYI